MIRCGAKASAKMEKGSMSRTYVRLETSSERGLAQMMMLGACMLLVMVGARSGFAQESEPKTFSSAAEASHALFLAVRSDDDQAVGAVLGVGKDDTAESEKVKERLEREHFARKYEEMHRLVQELDGSTVLYIGAENWPFPIPLVSQNDRWYFDPDAGAQEILFRRVGKNEATAIQVCRAFATARKQQESEAGGDDPVSQYTRNLVTVGNASADETSASLDKESSLFHGYYFRVVKTRGLSLVAYPADYRASGVMTFIVTKTGTAYEKNLGPDTTKLAPSLKEPKSLAGWHPAE